MAKFLSGRQSNLNIGIKSYTENQTVLQTIGKVGIGTTNAGNYSLYVVGDAYFSGIVTSANFNATVGIITNITGVAGTITNFNATVGIITNITGTNLNYSGISTLGVTSTTNLTSQQLNVSGISTLGVTSATNLTSQQLNVSGITTLGVTSTTNLTSQQLNVSGFSTVGVLTATSIGIGTTNPTVKLWVNGDGYFIGSVTSAKGFYVNGELVGSGSISGGSIVGTALSISGISTFGGSSGVVIKYENGSGIITSANPGVSTITYYGDGKYLDLTNNPRLGIGRTFTPGAVNGNLFYHIDYGRIFIYYDEVVLGIGTDAFWVDAAPFNVGIITSFLNGTGVGVGSTGSINTTGIITATSFFGNGSGLTGAGSTVTDDTSTNQTFYPIFTQTTSGTITASKVSTTKLNFNPSTGALTATDINSTSDQNLKTNIHTVNNALETISTLRGVSFDWKETGKSSYGVIAQELQEVLPELVNDGEVKSVNYNGIIGVLIEAIKELKKEVEDLKKTK